MKTNPQHDKPVAKNVSDTSPPLITIGLSCYNAAGIIQRAIVSALAQDWPRLELLIVDDCSTDGSVAEIEEVIVNAPHAHLLRHSHNGGPASARNTILAGAQGGFVVFFDDDDESEPDRVRVQYETLRDYESLHGVALVACYASGARCYPNGYELQIDAIGSQPEIPKGEVVLDYLLFNGRKKGVFYGAGTPTCALMARRSTFMAVDGFDNNLCRVEDVDFAVRLAWAGGHFIGCPEPLYLQHATIAADKTPQKNLEAELHMVEKHSDYLKRKGRYRYAREWFKIRFYHFSGQHLRFLAALSLFLIRYPFSGLKHLLRSAPSRLQHEKKMLERTQSQS